MRQLTLTLVLAAVLHAQQPPMPEVAQSNLPAQPIGPNDLIAISVYRAPELSRTLRVAPDGFIDLPLLDTRLSASGLLPRDVETSIAEALRTANLLVDPYVKVTVVEYYSRPISVAGAVRRPITFQAIGPVTLLEALSRAEGLTPDAGTEIVVSSPSPDPTLGAVVRRIPAARLLNDADPHLNVRLTGGEEIRVPEAGRIYVVGNVRKPGAFAVRDQTPPTLLKILAQAEGLAPFAGKQAFLYRRNPATGSKDEIVVPIEQIMKRKSPDIALTIDDILYIPDNNGRRIGLAALEKALLFGSTAGATALVWRR
jgi:polysaccharide export outer membrane protein